MLHVRQVSQTSSKVDFDFPIYQAAQLAERKGPARMIPCSPQTRRVPLHHLPFSLLLFLLPIPSPALDKILK